MKFKVKVHPNSSKEEIEKRDKNQEVWLKEKPIENKVNLKLMKMLKKYFKREIEITSGLTSKNKIIKLK